MEAMNIFNLPLTAEISQIVPKNAFDAYTNANQKRQFADLIQRITWAYKLAPETVHIAVGQHIQEIQVFHIALKEQKPIPRLLDIIDKAIPYTLIFIVSHEERVYVSVSVKHPHQANPDNAVIDHTFSSPWFLKHENPYSMRLEGTLDDIIRHLCIQLSGESISDTALAASSLQNLVQHIQSLEKLQKEIQHLHSRIKKIVQFNMKVELNIQLQQKEQLLEQIRKEVLPAK